MRFTLNGQQIELTAEDVQDRLRNVSPEPIQEYGIWIGSALRGEASLPRLRDGISLRWPSKS